MVNKDLILREELAIARTKMAAYRTFLSFLRTALYFPVAGISMHQGLDISYGIHIQWVGITIGIIILLCGVIFFIRSAKKIKAQTKFIGDYTIQAAE